VIVVGANLTVDRTLRVERLIPGTVMRPLTVVVTAGGKAVNVCRASRAWGVRPRLVANLPGRAVELVGDLLAAEGHDVVPVRSHGEIRTATILIEDDRRISVINEPGPPMSAADHDAFLDAVDRECFGHGVVALSGSLPPGEVASGLYAEVVVIARKHGLRVVVDAARSDLAAALPAGPDVVTPNLAEALAMLSGHASSEAVEPDLPNLHSVALDAANQLREAGAGAALVTVGRHGVAAADSEGAVWISAPKVTEVSAIGAGDAFVAGLCCTLEQGLGLRDATVRAVASGAASVCTDLAGQVDERVLADLLATSGLPGWAAVRPADGVAR
jgi:1-phosphofructokinase family hexose kinase